MRGGVLWGAPLPVFMEILMGMLLVLAAVIVVVLLMVIGDLMMKLKQIQNEAVDRGYARWVENRDGDVLFKWGKGWFL